MSDLDRELRKQLSALLKKAQAHATYDDAVKDMPVNLRGIVPEGLPYSVWQLIEHIRIAQRDILDFSDNADGSYKELNWPDDYWPKSPEPPDEHAWQKSIDNYHADLRHFEKLIEERDLAATFPWDKDKNLLREAFLIADHVAYHVGEIIAARRMLGVWRSK
ncbi:MAG: DinB family protein [Acidobacteria bacterium]|nr:DinB family protein [Acidobacteriota bacterium]